MQPDQSALAVQRQVLDGRGCDVRFDIWKARVLAPEGELAHEAERRLLTMVGRQPQVVR